ncbi:MAG: hypothetical protein AAFX58_12790 [Pseudomonadota bacterium]
MSSLVAVLARYTANVAMILGLLVMALAGYDYFRGSGAGQTSTLAGVVIGALVFLAGQRFFRGVARELEDSAGDNDNV